MSRASSPDRMIRPDFMSDWECEQMMLDTRRILMVGDVTDDVAGQTITYLQRLARDSENLPVHLYISSNGGDVDAGFGIVDQMLLMPCDVKTIITGRAYSMGAVIAAYGTRGRRYIMPHATAMLHPAWFGLGEDDVDKQQKSTDFIKCDWDHKIASLAKRMGQSKKRLAALIDKGLWMHAKCAIRYGLVDGIWTPTHEANVNKFKRNRTGSDDPRLVKVAQIMETVAKGIRQGEELSVEKDPT